MSFGATVGEIVGEGLGKTMGLALPPSFVPHNNEKTVAEADRAFFGARSHGEHFENLETDGESTCIHCGDLSCAASAYPTPAIDHQVMTVIT